MSPPAWRVLDGGDEEDNSSRSRHPYQQQLEAAFPDTCRERDPFTCGDCVRRTLRDRQSWCALRRLVIGDKDPSCELFDLRASA